MSDLLDRSVNRLRNVPSKVNKKKRVPNEKENVINNRLQTLIAKYEKG